MYLFVYIATPHRTRGWQPNVTSATVVDLYFLKVPGKFRLHNKTNKCAYLKCVYHILFITDTLEPLSRSSVGQIYEITGSIKRLLNCIL